MEGLSGVNFTFVDLDAHGAADCVATIKLRHDKHATQRLSQWTKQMKQQRKQRKREEINKI